jgi:hypothetical protein
VPGSTKHRVDVGVPNGDGLAIVLVAAIPPTAAAGSRRSGLPIARDPGDVSLAPCASRSKG